MVDLGKSRLTRRAVTAGLLGFAASATVCARAASPPHVRVALLPTDSATELYVAQSEGFFSRAGLTSDITVANNGVVISAGILSGGTDIGEVNVLSLISAHARHVPLSIVAPGALCTTEMSLGHMMVLQGSPIRTAADLNNKTVAVNSLKGIGWIAAANWMDHNGGDSRSVHFIEMAFSLMPPALQEGRIEAALIQEPTLTRTARAGGVRSIGEPYASIAPRWLLSAWASNTSWIQSHSADARSFAVAVRGASEWSNRHRDQTAAILSQLTKIPLDVTRSMGRYDFAVQPDPALLDPVIDVAYRYGVIASRFQAAELFSPTLTPA